MLAVVFIFVSLLNIFAALATKNYHAFGGWFCAGIYCGLYASEII